MSHRTQGSKGSEDSTDASHTGRVRQARPDGTSPLKQILPRALVAAALAGGTCASLAAGHDRAVAADTGPTLHAVTTAQQEPEARAGSLPDPDRIALQDEPGLAHQFLMIDVGPPDGDAGPAAGSPGAATPSAGGSAGPSTGSSAGPSAGSSGSPSAAASGSGSGSRPVAHPPGPSGPPSRPSGHRRRRRHHHRSHRIRLSSPGSGGASGAAASGSPGSIAAAGQGIAAAVRNLDWGNLAHCEASNRPDAVDPTGTYGGLYQFDARTWHSVGGHGLPQDAPAAEQTMRAMLLYARRGSQPWPVCGGRLYQ